MSKLLLAQFYDGEVNGLLSIATFVGEKHEVKISIGDDILDDIRDFKPHVVGVYVLTQDHIPSLELAKKIKEVDKDILVMFGGPHPTHYPLILLAQHVDAICLGEGEKPTLNLLDRIETKQGLSDIPSLWIKEEGQIRKNPLDTLLESHEIPVIDRRYIQAYFEKDKARELTVLCSRGCPFRCNFCINYSEWRLYPNGNFRIRRVEDIISEIKNSLKLFDSLEFIKFQDDIFGMDKQWMTKFLKEYKKEINLPFYCLLRYDLLSGELIDQLVEAGCSSIGLGVETGDENIRNEVLGKKLSDKKILDGTAILKSKDIRFHTFNMFGLPGEDVKEALKTLDFNIRLGPDAFWSSIFQPYPGTKFFTKDVEADIIKPNFNRFKINHRYCRDYKKIQRIQKLSALAVKYKIVRQMLPLLINLPFDSLYDWISKTMWEMSYSKNIKK